MDVRTRERSGWLRSATPRTFAALAATALMAGCSRAPTFNILGSFFPAWLICIVAGIVLAVVTNRVLIWLKLDQEIAWSIVVYPSIALFFACVLWLIFFS
jgi:hypothetical protein